MKTFRRTKNILLYMASSVLLTTCSLNKPNEHFDPSSFQFHKITPPEFFRQWWHEVEQCSGLSGNFNRVRWFVAERKYIPCDYRTGFCYGGWHRLHDIYLSEILFEGLYSGVNSQIFLKSENGTKHEMLHDLLDGGADHPSPFDKCNLRNAGF